MTDRESTKPQQALREGQRTCIIGAGCTGITAAKALAERGILFDLFEKGSGLGGNWRYDNDNGMSSAYRTLHIITSKENMKFSDFPMPEDFPEYCHHTDVLRYFEAYAERYGITPQIQFKTEVLGVSPAKDFPGVWDVTFAVDGNAPEIRRYGAVLIANGHHWDPRFPEFPGQFHGETIHSHHYKTADPFRYQRVLVVGIGNSACDIAIDLCRVAESVHLSTRSGAWVVPKYLLGIPTDQWTSPLMERLPFWLRRSLFRLLLYMTVGNQERYGLKKPKHKLLSAHPTLNQELLSYVGHGRVKIKPNIRELQGEQVEFEDRSKLPFDSIILATGYNIRFPFLKPEVFEVKDNKIELYRRVVDPKLSGIYFLGLMQPVGSIMPLSEVQGKWIAGLLSGEMALPDGATMRREMDRDRDAIMKRYVHVPRHTIQVDFWDYMATIEREMKRGRKWAAQ